MLILYNSDKQSLFDANCTTGAAYCILVLLSVAFENPSVSFDV